MASALPRNFTRRAGSGWTVFTFGGQPISFCQQVQHTTPRPVGQGVSAIQPMDEPYPIEILTPAAAGMGQITLNLYELFGSNGYTSRVWDRLGMGASSTTIPFGAANQSDTSQFLNVGNYSGSAYGVYGGAVDIVDIYIKQAQATPDQLSVVQIFRPPPNPNGIMKPSFYQYVGCMITDVQDGETIDVGTLEVLKQVTIAYRYMLRDGQPSGAFALRDAILPAVPK